MPEMNSDIYLFLVRNEGKWSTLSDTYNTAGKMAAVAQVVKWVKSIVVGDSTDSPFVGFIKVDNVDHRVAYDDPEEQEEYSSQHHGLSKLHWSQIGRHGLLETRRPKTVQTNRRKSFETRNMFVQSHLPSHEKLTFEKKIDKATPQLAFGCSAQEKYVTAVFFYRRRTGLGIMGTRMPYMVIGLNKVLISDWSIDGDVEKVGLSYKQIAWAATAQIADTNLSIPGFTRNWDVESRRGGEGGWALVLQAITAALMIPGSALGKAIQTAYDKG